MSDDELQKYIGLVNDNVDEIVKYVDIQFNNSKESIKTKLIDQLREMLIPLPAHYYLKNDASKIIESGLISTDQTIFDFLKNEYTGEKKFIYADKHNKYYNYIKYGDCHFLNEPVMCIGRDIMNNAIYNYIAQKIGKEIPKCDFEIISEKCYGFDEIYDDCIASEFFYFESAIEFVGIKDVKLSKILK